MIALSARRPESLTATDRAIAGLVARGRTTQEVAALHVSPKTVDDHQVMPPAGVLRR